MLKRMISMVARATHVATVLPITLGMRLYGGTDKWFHGYTPYYARHLRRQRWARHRIVEIGVGEYERRSPGGSLRVWRDWFPRSAIVGMDISDKQVGLGRRVRFVRGDQSSPDDLQRVVDALGEAPTIVIDDGSHWGDHAETSFRFLFPLMPSGGWYVIEDLHTSYWPDFAGSDPAPDNTAVGFLRRLQDSVQSNDPTFARKPHHGLPPQTPIADVASVHVYPGIAFVEKRVRSGSIRRSISGSGVPRSPVAE